MVVACSSASSPRGIWSVMFPFTVLNSVASSSARPISTSIDPLMVFAIAVPRVDTVMSPFTV